MQSEIRDLDVYKLLRSIQCSTNIIGWNRIPLYGKINFRVWFQVKTLSLNGANKFKAEVCKISQGVDH